MPSRRSASARTGPTPLRYVTGVSRKRRWRPAVARSITWSLFVAQELARELGGVERHEIGGTFSDTEKLHRYVDRFVHGDDHTSFRGAVELRDDEPRHRHGGGERLGLLNRVLTDGPVEHQQCFMRRAGQTF